MKECKKRVVKRVCGEILEHFLGGVSENVTLYGNIAVLFITQRKRNVNNLFQRKFRNHASNVPLFFT